MRIRTRRLLLIGLVVLALLALGAAAYNTTQAGRSSTKLVIPAKSSLQMPADSDVAVVLTTSDGQTAAYTFGQLRQNAVAKRPLISVKLTIPCKKTRCAQPALQGDGGSGCNLEVVGWVNSNGTISGFGDFSGCYGIVLEGFEQLTGNTCEPVGWGCSWDTCYFSPYFDCNTGPSKTWYNLSPSSNGYWYVPTSGDWNYTPYHGLHCYGNWRYRIINNGWIANNDGTVSGGAYEQFCGS